MAFSSLSHQKNPKGQGLSLDEVRKQSLQEISVPRKNRLSMEEPASLHTIMDSLNALKLQIENIDSTLQSQHRVMIGLLKDRGITKASTATPPRYEDTAPPYRRLLAEAIHQQQLMDSHPY